MNLREEIKSQSVKIPSHVMQGSVQQVIRWKDRVNEALRLANNKNSSDYDLQLALNSIK
jgi:uncharacterized protein (DUF4415 family)